ncbi:MAG TPA: DUF2905 domain-containing protein [candidate division WOR-3 bacterium]|uniref:DUF2905 domain-containing protein n=1 Tax=candidate division WOR-3 bacterium TaxID=2052148 RepID=A0A9C9K103_UNCW3|nr:DUF2905 domain-containing protein [candidate division WOR-3 bacterium]
MYGIARFFIGVGVLFVIIGLLLFLFPKFNFLKLPGDIVVKHDNFILILPIATSILVSLILTILLNFIFRR